MKYKYITSIILIFLTLVGYFFLYNTKDESIPVQKKLDTSAQEKVVIPPDNSQSKNVKNSIEKEEPVALYETSDKHNPTEVEDTFEIEEQTNSSTLLEQNDKSKNTEESILEKEFKRDYKAAPTQKEKAKYIVRAVFDRETDSDWSKNAQLKLELMAKKLKSEYNLDYDVTAIRCSDVVCFVGLSGDFSEPKLDILQSFHKPLYEDIRLFKATNLFINDNFKQYSGLYLHRFNAVTN